MNGERERERENWGGRRAEKRENEERERENKRGEMNGGGGERDGGRGGRCKQTIRKVKQINTSSIGGSLRPGH